MSTEFDYGAPTLEQPLCLQKWFLLGYNEKKGTLRWDNSDKIYAPGVIRQVDFVKDQVARVFGSEYIVSGTTWRDSQFEVIGEHLSKSCRLPVYRLRLPKEMRKAGRALVMRGNFHDWNVTILSDVPIDEPLIAKLIKTNDYPLHDGDAKRS